MATAKMTTIPDSNVVLDLLTRDPVWFDWSARQLRRSRERGRVIVNAIIFAETSAQFDNWAEYKKTLTRIGIELAELPWAAAHEAGRAHTRYRQSGGTRSRTLPDFFIGAHAAVEKSRLLTRDPQRYRRYFPDLDIVAPDSHP